MTSLMSMEDLFYGPREPTWILPTSDEPRRRLYKEQEVEPPPRRVYKKPPPVRYDPRFLDEHRRPIVYQQLPKVHTVPEAPLRTQEEVRHVVQGPGAPPPMQPPQIVNKELPPPIQRPFLQPPIELKVPMCCEKCSKKVKDRLIEMEGVESVMTDQYNQKVVVTGNVDPARVLNRVKLVKKRSAFWDMTVDYSHAFRARQAEAVRAHEAARAKASKAPPGPAAGPEVVVKLPREENGPKVTVILPAGEKTMPYEVNSRAHSQRYVSPPKGYRQELYYGPDERSRPRGQYYDVPHGPHGEMRRPEHLDSYRQY